ncbi:uncharacterized protein Mb2253c-like [Dioscorea cayenensis subsp. rotundata]|uniref:Uncharacterized protein Mb2253c-like n=1 Tax=Dioscorea cayennensis subsp. rotundata TaxID=55577 RepID=A0AB40B858_DIOCR|nr:uncharacterized protein Mb2253c-like [Dioscorea cayenensis subsp. rotundata]
MRRRGIDIAPSKIKAITEMPPPKTLKQLRSFQGRLAYIRRFIANLSGRCKPFSKLMYFDGASSIQPAVRPKIPQVRAGIGLIFISPEGGILRYSLSLLKSCTNNEAEYEALIAGLELAVNMEIQSLHIYDDSQLIINQVEGSFKTYKQGLLQYHQIVIELFEQIPDVKMEKVSRSVNGKTYSLAKLEKELADPD